MDNRFTPLYFFTQVKHNPPPQAVANGNLETPFVLPPKQKISGEHLLGINIILYYTTKIFFKRINKKKHNNIKKNFINFFPGLYIYTFGESMYSIPTYTSDMRLQELPFCPKKHLKRLKTLSKHSLLFSKKDIGKT